MLPARDEHEFRLFPKQDVAFIHDWLAWTDAHMPHLARTVPLPGLDEVGLGLVRPPPRAARGELARLAGTAGAAMAR